MRVLVTGGAGFMGSDLVRRLATEGTEVSVVDKLTYAGDIRRISQVLDRIRFYKKDITHDKELEEIFSKEKPNVVIHYAAETHVDRSIVEPHIFVKSNVFGTLNVLKASYVVGVERFIHISTDEVYGELPLNSKNCFAEEDPLKPGSPYSASKASAEMLVMSFIKTYKLPCIIIRASNNYGHWQYPEKLIPLAILRLLSGEKVPLYGAGENIRTWLYVEDFTDAVIEILHKGKTGEIYNVASDEEVNNMHVVKSILSLMNMPEDFIEFVQDRPGHDLRYAVSTVKVKNQIGWEPKISFEEGLQRTVNWFLENKDWLFDKKKEVDKFSTRVKRLFPTIT